MGEQGQDLEILVIVAQHAFLVQVPQRFRTRTRVSGQKRRFDDRRRRVTVARHAVPPHGHVHHAGADLIGLTVVIAESGRFVVDFDGDLATGLFLEPPVPGFEKILLKAMTRR